MNAGSLGPDGGRVCELGGAIGHPLVQQTKREKVFP